MANGSNLLKVTCLALLYGNNDHTEKQKMNRCRRCTGGYCSGLDHARPLTAAGDALRVSWLHHEARPDVTDLSHQSATPRSHRLLLSHRGATADAEEAAATGAVALAPARAQWCCTLAVAGAERAERAAGTARAATAAAEAGITDEKDQWCRWRLRSPTHCWSLRSQPYPFQPDLGMGQPKNQGLIPDCLLQQDTQERDNLKTRG